MIAEADYCWFVGWGFTGARPSSQQVKPNDLARVLQQSRHYLMEHDTCNEILDAWNIDKKVPYRFLLLSEFGDSFDTISGAPLRSRLRKVSLYWTCVRGWWWWTLSLPTQGQLLVHCRSRNRPIIVLRCRALSARAVHFFTSFSFWKLDQ